MKAMMEMKERMRAQRRDMRTQHSHRSPLQAQLMTHPLWCEEMKK